MTAEMDVNGGGGELSVPPKDLPNGNVNADGGSVFVNGNGNENRDQNDAVSGDSVKTDLNSGSSLVVVVESELDSDKPVVESRESVSVVESESDQVEENGEEKIEVLNLEEKQESPLIVNDGTDGEVDRENELLESANGVGENPGSEVGVELVVIESANEVQCTPQEIESEPVDIAQSESVDIAERVHSLINDSADLSASENKISEANSTEGVKIYLDESASCPEGDIKFESQIIDGPADDGEPSSNTGHTEDVIPESVSVSADASQDESASCPEGDIKLECQVIGGSADDGEPSSNIGHTEDVISESVSVSADAFETPESSSEVEDGTIDSQNNNAASVSEPEASQNNKAASDSVPEAVASQNNNAGLGTATEAVAGQNNNAPEGVPDVENGPPVAVSIDVISEISGSEIESAVEKESAADNLNEEIQLPEGVVENDPLSIDLNNDLRSEIEANVVSEEKVSTLPIDSIIEPRVSEGVTKTEVELEKASTHVETKVPEVIVGSFDCLSISVDHHALEKHDPVEKKNSVATSPADANMSSRGGPCEGEQVENGEIQSTDKDNDDKTHHQVDPIDGIHRDEAPAPTPESSVASPKAQNMVTEAVTASEAQNVVTEAVTASEAQNVDTEAVTASEAQNVGTEVVKRPFYCLIKVPRFEDDNLKEQIKLFQLKVDEKTRSRDAIRDLIHSRRATFKESGENLETTISEEKAAREMLKSKRQEIDSLQSVINKVKNAISVEDIDGRIRQMRHMIEHETLPLKEEKQLIREIEQLKQHREQFSSCMGKHDEIQQAFDQKDQIEERLKVLRKEADSLRENVSKAEAATQAVRKKHKDLSEKLRELQAQFKAADDTRQEAYKSLQSLRKQAYDKNKYFWKYKDDVKAANDLLSKGDKEALLNLCDNQVESVLEMWNNNDEFRKEYVRCNINSTLRRLRTLDGRSLGPNEEPPVIRPVVISRVTRGSSASQISTVKEEKPAQIVPVKIEKENKSMARVGVEKVQAIKSQRPAKPAPLENGSATVSGRKEIEEAREEEPKRTKEEEELARKAEELRKKEEAAKLQEQRRLEEKEKAKEALERKKRVAEKAQARAALRAQKEAEQKEKEREKKARKKEKKKVAAVEEDTSVTNDEESAPSTETPTETPSLSDVKDRSTTVTKKPQKPSQFAKQTKSKSIPLPLRNRGKKRMQSWMWVVIAALFVFALFLLGNSSFSFKSGLQWFGF